MCAFKLQDLPPAGNPTVTPYAKKNLLNYWSYQAANRIHVDWETENEAVFTLQAFISSCCSYHTLSIHFPAF